MKVQDSDEVVARLLALALQCARLHRALVRRPVRRLQHLQADHAQSEHVVPGGERGVRSKQTCFVFALSMTISISYIYLYLLIYISLECCVCVRKVTSHQPGANDDLEASWIEEELAVVPDASDAEPVRGIHQFCWGEIMPLPQ